MLDIIRIAKLLQITITTFATIAKSFIDEVMESEIMNVRNSLIKFKLRASILLYFLKIRNC